MPLSDSHVYPGGAARLECRYRGFGEQEHPPLVKWTFKPKQQGGAMGDPHVANSFLATTSVVDANWTSASLEIPHVLYKHSGAYTVNITDPRTGQKCQCSGALKTVSTYIV